jgi:ribonucleoside-diphosphate reductase alpha chain
LDLLERVKWFYTNWVKPGHRNGQNTHNISATVSIKEGEWEEVGEWMWENRKFYNGLSVLPYSDHTYMQAPFEDCTKEKYEELMISLTNINLSKIIEIADNTNLQGEIACGVNGCEIK